ncbi:MAG: hypothetical protein AB7O91_08315, partial [Sphingomonas sp.]
AMKAQLALLTLILLAGCGERLGRNETGGGSNTPPLVREEEDRSLLGNASVPVRIGELGAGFAACGARGTTRERPGISAVPVRAAPYDANREIDRLGAGVEFFICARSHDQRWFGIVYMRPGQDIESCGLSGPVPRRTDYEGSCASGWVPSALVRMISGAAHQLPPSTGTIESNSSTAQPAG